MSNCVIAAGPDAASTRANTVSYSVRAICNEASMSRSVTDGK
ncbi:hypothetical protein [Nocardia sp. NBC_01009]|nr:hypothetical protein OHA42_29525 [Nocardia sp. NBC_01009]